MPDNSMDLSDPKVENMDNETDPSMDIQETGEDKYRLSLQVFNIALKKIFNQKLAIFLLFLHLFLHEDFVIGTHWMMPL